MPHRQSRLLCHVPWWWTMAPVLRKARPAGPFLGYSRSGCWHLTPPSCWGSPMGFCFFNPPVLLKATRGRRGRPAVLMFVPRGFQRPGASNKNVSVHLSSMVALSQEHFMKRLPGPGKPGAEFSKRKKTTPKERLCL